MAEIDVKKIHIAPIDSRTANAFVKATHYSGKVVNNSQLHFGAFYDGKLHGVMQYGPSLDKSKMIGLVEGTKWNEFIELNRMAFDAFLPRNSESRCIAISIRLIKKHAPHIRWIVSFADGTQCGDGTIYRASGFALTGIKINKRLIGLYNEPEPKYRGIVAEYKTSFQVMHPLYFQAGQRQSELQKRFVSAFRSSGVGEKEFVNGMGAEYLPGFQLRYIYLIDKTARLTVPVLPFSTIDEMGAGMYKGENIAVIDRKPADEAQR